MAKLIRTKRLGNSGQYDEGSAGNLLIEGDFQVTDALHVALRDAVLVTSKWTGAKVIQDGEGPDYKNAKGADRLLSDLFESDNIDKVGTVDLEISFTAADYGYKDDFATDLADPI